VRCGLGLLIGGTGFCRLGQGWRQEPADGRAVAPRSCASVALESPGRAGESLGFRAGAHPRADPHISGGHAEASGLTPAWAVEDRLCKGVVPGIWRHGFRGIAGWVECGRPEHGRKARNAGDRAYNALRVRWGSCQHPAGPQQVAWKVAGAFSRIIMGIALDDRRPSL
jgi:hypothetical protein